VPKFFNEFEAIHSWHAEVAQSYNRIAVPIVSMPRVHRSQKSRERLTGYRTTLER
jgi:hypothetical protein